LNQHQGLEIGTHHHRPSSNLKEEEVSSAVINSHRHPQNQSVIVMVAYKFVL
jgi:hypothetical protein